MKTISLQNLWDAPAKDVPQDFPYFAQLLAQMRELIEQSQAVSISTFQMGNPAVAPRDIICPMTGRKCRPLRSRVTRDKTVFLEYDGAPVFWLALSNLSRGYPPSAVYYLDRDLLIKFDDPVWGVRDYQIIELRQILLDSAVGSIVDAKRDILVTGDQNFAHVLWNQLPGLIAVCETQDFRDARVVVTHEPIAPLELLVPGLTTDRIVRVSPYMLLNAVNGMGAHMNAPGSFKIPGKVIRSVREVCANLASERARAISQRLDTSDNPVIWISLRAHERTAVNQQEVVEKLISKIFETYDGASIILDGFSLPFDVDTNFDYSDDLRLMADKTSAMADEIISNLGRTVSGNPAKVIYNACGLLVSDSLFLASYVNFYFCHHGTVQHKVGWIANCYGLVHSNTAIVDERPETWASSMVEEGVSPAYLRRNFIQDVDDAEVPEDDQARALRKGNYVFLTPDKLVDDIMAHIEVGLHHPALGLSASEILTPYKQLTEMKMADTNTTDLTPSARRLNHLSRATGAQTYLEVGVEKGQTFFDVDIPLKVAVDPEFRFDCEPLQSAKVKFFPVTSDEFFSEYGGQPFDLVFLDGLHHFEQTLRDLMNVLVFSHEHTVVLIDDVLPTDAYSGLRDHADAIFFRDQAGGDGLAWHGDVFKVIFFIHDFLPGLNYATIDDGWNRQTLVWKQPRTDFKPVFNDLEKISRLTYFDLYKNLGVMRLRPEDEVLALATAGRPVEPVPFRELKPLGPKSLSTRISRKFKRIFSN